MQQDVPNDYGAGWSDPQHSISIPDDNAGFTINVEDPDAVAIALRAMPLTYGSGGSFYSGAPALYSPQVVLPVYSEWGIPDGYESDNSSVYHSTAVSDSFEELKPSSLTSDSGLVDSVNTWRLTNESVNPQRQPSEPYVENGLSNASNASDGVSLSHGYQQGPSDTLDAHHHHDHHPQHLDFHPTPPSYRSHLHYDHALHEINQRPAFEPPPTGSWSSQSSDYLNPFALPVNAPSPTGSESGASDVSSAGSTRSSRGRDQAAITKRRKQSANYHCEICDKADFTTSARLKSHKASKHDGQTYQCSYAGCEKVYRHSTSRDRHFHRDHRSDAASGSKQPDQPRTYSPYRPY